MVAKRRCCEMSRSRSAVHAANAVADEIDLLSFPFSLYILAPLPVSGGVALT